MTCRKLNWKKPCKALFGSYLEAHEDPVVTNGMKGRRFDYLFLGPTANRQGTSNFFDLITGKVKKPRTITKYPMPNRIIKLANGWGLRFQKEENKQKLIFMNRHKQRYDWDNEDLDIEERLVLPYPDHTDIPDELPGVSIGKNDHNAIKVIIPSE